jgi:hypothetical protein
LGNIWTLGSGWAKVELGFHQPKKMTGGYFWDYGARHHPFKTLNGQLSVVQRHPKGGKFVKALGTIRSYLFKASRLKP